MHKPDYILLLSIVILFSIGLLMIYSASTAMASIRGHNAPTYFYGQGLRTIIGLIISIFIVFFMKYEWLEKYAGTLFVISLILLGLAFVSPFGVIVNGARRWVNILGIQFQPAEIARLAIVTFIARYLSNNAKSEDDFKDFTSFITPVALVVGSTAILIILQPDFSFSLLIIIVTTIMLVLAKIPLRYIGGMALFAVLLLGILALSSPYRVERIKGYLLNEQSSKIMQRENSKTNVVELDEHYLKNRYQTVQSLISLGSGNLLGKGLGQSQQKFFFLPEPYTDFIFAILGEETGFIGTTITMLLFLIILYRGVLIARTSPDRFTFFLTSGITSFIFVEAMINIGVVTGALPVTGLPLPFVSYGSSSQVINLISIAIVLNISRFTRKETATYRVNEGQRITQASEEYEISSPHGERRHANGGKYVPQY